MIDVIGVAIPARDEGGSIVTCLTSIAAAGALVAVPVTVVLAADTCLDDTVAWARATAVASDLDLVVVPCHVGSAGLARQVAARRLLERLDATGVRAARTWIATTDADTHVPVDWFARQLAWEATGLDGVAGLVDIGPDAPAEMRVSFEMATAHEGRGPGHRHVHGANLAVRGSSLRRVGGFPAVALGEDHELWRRLAATRARLLGVADMTVVTSRRLTSHTVGGFASYLAGLARAEPVAARERRGSQVGPRRVGDVTAVP